MFFSGKRTVYLSLYHDGQKVKPAGFLQITEIRERLKLTIKIKDSKEIPDAKYGIFVCSKESRIQVGNISLQGGNGCFEKQFCTSNDRIHVKEAEVPVAEITEITVMLQEKEKISGYLTSKKESVTQLKTAQPNDTQSITIQPDMKAQAEEKRELQREEEFFAKQEPIFLREPELLCMDKWEQILKKYHNVHPFDDDRVFVSLDLQELVILPEKYQKLIHNSFLLHGFYNYRHIILGKDYRLGNSMEKCFYLGVPGVFFEREKQVAVMFGFEGFECAGAVETGKFGYYVREVSI